MRKMQPKKFVRDNHSVIRLQTTLKKLLHENKEIHRQVVANASPEESK